ncbi:MAG: PAS domain S-box protein [Deltaproteobacteria bacterium]|nr:PAS domain S-box protein [Deltaproteobacteria bacterium]
MDSSPSPNSQNAALHMTPAEDSIQTVLQRINHVFNSTLDLNEVLQKIIAEIVPLFAAQSASVILYHETTQEAEISTSYTTAALHALRYPLVGSLAGWVATHKRPLRVASVTAEEWPTSWQVAVQLGAPPLQVSVLLVPLWRQGAVIGSLEVVWQAPHAVTDYEEHLLEAVAVPAALALTNARLYQEKAQALQAAKASEEQFRLLSAASPVGIFQTDAQGQALYTNQRWQEITGVTLAESLGDGWSRALHPEDRAAVVAAWTADARAGREFSREVRLLTEQQGVRWVYTRSRAMRTEDGTIIGHVGTVEDITERKQTEDALRASEERYRTLFENANDGIACLTAEGIITSVNRGLETMLGWSRTEMIGQSYQRFHTPPSLRTEEERIRRVRAGEKVSSIAEIELVHKDGTVIPVEAHTRFMRNPDGKAIGVLAILRDITKRRAVDQMKDEFVSVVSHELRTPLTSIRGALGLLTSGLVGALPDKGQRMLEIALNNTDRLIRLINDILDIERMQSGKVTLQCKLCDAALLLGQAVDEMQAMADKAGVTLALAPQSLRLWADPDRLVQTLTNLLSNAIKFSPPGGTVSVRVVRQDKEAICTVQDQGRGIPADKLETIFERFQQVDTSDARHKGGTGLGLAICRSIVQQHGGRIWVESRVGTGSTFSFTVPLWSETEQAGIEPVGQPLVLVCDDDPAVLAVIEAVLEQRGYQVVTATTGQETVALAEVQQPAVILLDLLMPQMNGWETMAALKRNPVAQHIPIIIFSLLSPPAVPPPHAGFVEWVEKSQGEAALVEALKRALEERAKVARVLVVEDDLDLSRVLLAMFQRHGIETVHARTGREAIERCEQEMPNLLVLDVILPDGDGFLVADWLRQQDRLRQVPVMVYSAKDLDAGERERLQVGQTEFFTKGRITPEEFKQHVIQWLSRILPAGERGSG